MDGEDLGRLEALEEEDILEGIGMGRLLNGSEIGVVGEPAGEDVEGFPFLNILPLFG